MSLLSLLLMRLATLVFAISGIELLLLLFLASAFSKTSLVGLSEDVYLGIPSGRAFSANSSFTPKRLQKEDERQRARLKN